MAVYKRGKVYWISFAFNHQRFRKRSPDNSVKGANAYEQLIRQKLARGEPLVPPKPIAKVYFKDVCLQWLNVWVKNNNKPYEFKMKQYVLNADIIPYFGSKDIKAIGMYEIEQYKEYLIRKRNLSPKTVNNHLCIINRCLKTAQEWKIIKEIPAIKLLKVPPQKYDFLTEAEATLLVQTAKRNWHDTILLALRAGLRFGEISALKWEDVNLVENILTVSGNIVRGFEGSPKNNKVRTIPLSPSVVKMLGKRIRDDRYIFHNTDGTPIKYNYSLRMLKKVCQQAGLREIGWHTLRHSFASHLATKRISIVAIKELMGHSDIKTTMRYAHVNLPVLQNAIEELEHGFLEIATIMPQPNNMEPEFNAPTRINLQNYLRI